MIDLALYANTAVYVGLGTVVSTYVYKSHKLDDKLDQVDQRLNQMDIEKTKHAIHIIDLRDDVKDLKETLNTATGEIKDLLITMAKNSSHRKMSE